MTVLRKTETQKKALHPLMQERVDAYKKEIEMRTMNTETPVPDNTVTEATPVAQTLQPATNIVQGAFLAQWAATPKCGRARKPKREPSALLAYAIERGAVITLDEPTLTELEPRGIKRTRIANAVCGLKKFYGVPVTASRTGRQVTAYTVQL